MSMAAAVVLDFLKIWEVGDFIVVDGSGGTGET